MSRVAPMAVASERWVGWLGTMLVLGCLGIYAHVTEFGFVTFDDEHNIAFNPHLGPWSWAKIRWAFTDAAYARRYMPLGWLGFAGIFSGAGLAPAAYHGVVLVLHVVNTLLLFGLLRRLAGTPCVGVGSADENWRTTAAFLGAAIWAWHPLRVESVAWASGLLYQQAEFFLLIALVLFVRRPTSRVSGWIAVGGYAASLLTYPLALGFVPVFALLGRWQGAPWRRAVRKMIPFAAVAVVVVVVNLVARLVAADAFLPAPTLAESPLAVRAVQTCYLWVYYVWKPWWPTGLTLFNPVLVGVDPASAPFVASVVALAVFSGLVAFWPAAQKRVGFFLIAHLCVLVPMLGWLERPHFPSDRYAAFPQGVLAVALTLGLVRVQAVWRRRSMVAALGAVAIGMGVLSARQTEVWRDAWTLFAHVKRSLPAEKFPMMYYERPAVLLYRSGDAAGALALFDAGLARVPGNASLAAAREALLRDGVAHRARLSAAGAPPGTPPEALLQQTLGLEAARAGDWGAALAHLRWARAMAPGFHEPLYNLALVWLARGEVRPALGCYLWAETCGGAAFPASARSYLLARIAQAFEETGEIKLAAAARARAVSVSPSAR
ncbi:MAG: hypothetical protein H7343_11360 [Undibacterium sp.]|nr:hypothetical protein [Opitutaceae bacterium]